MLLQWNNNYLNIRDARKIIKIPWVTYLVSSNNWVNLVMIFLLLLNNLILDYLSVHLSVLKRWILMLGYLWYVCKNINYYNWIDGRRLYSQINHITIYICVYSTFFNPYDHGCFYLGFWTSYFWLMFISA